MQGPEFSWVLHEAKQNSSKKCNYAILSISETNTKETDKKLVRGTSIFLLYHTCTLFYDGPSLWAPRGWSTLTKNEMCSPGSERNEIRRVALTEWVSSAFSWSSTFLSDKRVHLYGGPCINHTEREAHYCRVHHHDCSLLLIFCPNAAFDFIFIFLLLVRNQIRIDCHTRACGQPTGTLSNCTGPPLKVFRQLNRIVCP